MTRLSIAALVFTASTSLAQGGPPPAAKAAPPAAPTAAPAGAPDMSKLGPWTRKVTNEAAVKKEIQAFFDGETALMKAKNWDAMIARVDFPVFMSTDNAAGVVSADAWDQARYVNEMKPMWENASPDSTTKHKLTVTLLSDSLANVVDEFTMTEGKQTMKGRNSSLLVKVGGQWRFKAMTEAGWGDMGAPPAPTPAPSPAPAPAAAPAPAPAKK